MPEIWPVNLTPADKQCATLLGERRKTLGLDDRFAPTIRAALKLALTASDEDLKRGEL